MRLVFFGQSGPFAATALQHLVAALAARGQAAKLVGVVEAPGSKRSPHRGRLFGFAGPGAGLPPLAGSFDLQVHAHALGAGHHWWATAAETRAATAFVARVRGEVAVCVGFPFVWPATVLRAFARAINVHPSLLPRWRGPSPLFWWLRSGESSTGISVHAMVEEADAGPVWARAELAPPWRTEGGALLQLCGRLGARLAATVLAQRLPLALPVLRPTGADAAYAARPRPEDGFVLPHRWPAAALLRFAHGAPYFRTPSLMVAGHRRFVRGAYGCLPSAQVPGDFVRVGDVLWVQARGGAVGLQLQT